MLVQNMINISHVVNTSRQDFKNVLGFVLLMGRKLRQYGYSKTNISEYEPIYTLFVIHPM